MADEEWERHVATEVRGEAGLILVQPSWRGRDPPAHGQGHPPPTRAAHRSATHHQVYVGRSQSPTRGRARAPHNSPPGARHPSPTRVPRDLSPIRPVHQKRTPPRPHAHTRDRSVPLHARAPHRLDLRCALDTGQYSPTPTPATGHDAHTSHSISLKTCRQHVGKSFTLEVLLTVMMVLHRSESPVSPRERFQDARDKFRSLERDWQRPDRPDCQARPHAHGGVCRTPSWEPNPKGGSGVREARGSVEQGGRDEGVWPKSDRDTGYGSRDGLLRERPRGRDFDRGYGTCDTRDSDPWRREVGHRTPDPWQREPRAPSPTRAPRGRSPTREYRVPRVRSPDRTDYHRAKSMHDLSQRRAANENEEDRGGCNDPRRRSMYDTAEDPRPLRESRTNRHYRSQASLRRHNSCSSDSCHSADSYNELPETRRFPGLDRATARPDPLEHARGHPHTAHLNSKRTFDYPVNGGTAAVHISRAQHDDYRRFRYDHTTTPQFIRSTSVPTTHY
ncbi:putative Serine/arginine repetitive matrix protein 1-like 5 [Homarus americanus]|uniref:Putative Serine/arginine repetitive matrix protein 1-like 5 n=1 Tax=Homarus americanus TaxID=6706 RepID=A0A8J5TJE7_HOMAM|nr:putative Serine/arginine repetitive matrix protein 1-like 5 [Homarus americanus]